MAGALFAVHPVHTEAVTWIAGVGDLACGIFFLATLLTFFRYLKSQQTKWLWASSVCLLAALFSKEMAATFPIIAGLGGDLEQGLPAKSQSDRNGLLAVPRSDRHLCGVSNHRRWIETSVCRRS